MSATWNSYLKGRWQGTGAWSTLGSAVGAGEEARTTGEDGGMGGASDSGVSSGVGKPSVSWR